MQKVSEKEAIERIKQTPLMRHESEYAKTSELGQSLRKAISALEKQEKLKERIAELTEKRKKNPWEEMFVGEVVKLLEEFVAEE